MNVMTTEISFTTANNFTTTKESRNYLMSILSVEEQKLFKDFVKQVGAK